MLSRRGIHGIDTSGQLLILLSVLSIGGLIYVVRGATIEFREGSPNAAIDWVFNHRIGGETDSSPSQSESSEKGPPPTENKKNRIKFERADRQCEYCDKQSDLLEIHHIRSRASGGTNRPSNLIALCPDCHRKADRGVYSQSELRYKIKGKS